MTQILLDWYVHECRRIYDADPGGVLCNDDGSRFLIDGKPVMVGSKSARPGALLIGTQVWGDKYLDRMARFLVPTLLAPANIAALSGSTRMLIYTREHEVEKVREIVKPLEERGIEIEIAIGPPLHREGTETLELSNIVLGAIHCAMMAAAGHWQMEGMHATYADHVYSDHWFANLAKVVAAHPEGVAHYSLTGQLETADPEIETFRVPDGSLPIPALDLGDIVFRHQHQQQRPFLLNDLPPGRMSPTSFLVWRGKDRIWLRSPHMNPLFINWHDCMRVTVRGLSIFTIQAPLDTRLPYVFSRMPYVPTVDDELESIELSDVSKPKRVDSTFDDFAQITHLVMRWSDDYMPFWKRKSVLRIRPHGLPYVDEAEADRQFAEITERLMSVRERLAIQSLQETKNKIGWVPVLQEDA